MNVIVVTPGAESPNLVQFLPWGQTMWMLIVLSYLSLLCHITVLWGLVGFIMSFFYLAVVIQCVIQSNGSLDTAVANAVINPARPLHELKVFPLN